MCILSKISVWAPPPPPLPPLRVEEKPPFTYTGVDFAGPLYTRENVAASYVKVWICLYTCCVSRAVHLDIVTELSSAAFLRSFIRFTARRGTPTRVLSDNGKTFVAASKIISSIFKHPDVQAYFLDHTIKWQFNVERAPWWGGVFERMIQSAKRCLRKIIGSSKLTYDELMTAVVQVESLLNSRPLTYISADDFVQPLTPSHLLMGRRIMTLPDTFDNEEEEYIPVSDKNVITRRMKHLSKTLEQFWNRWKCEYLLELRNSHRRVYSPSSSTVAIGDIVIVEGENVPRGLWKLGIVDKIMPGRDGEVRAAMVRTHSKDNKIIMLNRPIEKLYPLEINETENRNHPIQELSHPLETTNTENHVETTPLLKHRNNDSLMDKPKRVAAQRATERIRLWAKELNSEYAD